MAEKPGTHEYQKKKKSISRQTRNKLRHWKIKFLFVIIFYKNTNSEDEREFVAHIWWHMLVVLSILQSYREAVKTLMTDTLKSSFGLRVFKTNSVKSADAIVKLVNHRVFASRKFGLFNHVWCSKTLVWTRIGIFEREERSLTFIWANKEVNETESTRERWKQKNRSSVCVLLLMYAQCSLMKKKSESIVSVFSTICPGMLRFRGFF